MVPDNLLHTGRQEAFDRHMTEINYLTLKERLLKSCLHNTTYAKIRKVDDMKPKFDIWNEFYSKTLYIKFTKAYIRY